MIIELTAPGKRLEEDRQKQRTKKSALYLLIYLLFLAEAGCTASARRAVRAVVD